MLLSEMITEFLGLPKYEDCNNLENPGLVAAWCTGRRLGTRWEIIFDPGLGFGIRLGPAMVASGLDADALVLTVRQIATVGAPVICPSEGPVAYAAQAILPGIGYKTVYWFADQMSPIDADGLHESAESALHFALGAGAKAGVITEAWCLGHTAQA